MDNRNISIYNGVSDTRGRDTTFDAVLARIQHGGRNLQQKTRDLNKWYHENPTKYGVRKEELPAVIWSGRFERGNRNKSGLVQHSGLIVLDVDKNIDLGTVTLDFQSNPHVLLAFVSPSGQGMKPVIPIDPIPQNANEHEHAFNAVLEVFSEYAEKDPTELPKQRNVDRLCFLAYDPHVIYNPNAVPVEWEVDETAEQEKRERQERASQNAEVYGDVSIENAKHVLSFVPRDLPYMDWRNVGMGIKSAGLPVSVFQEWSKGQRLNSKGVWVSEDCHAHWNRYNSTGITWGSVVHIAKQNGYTPPRKRKPVKLQSVAKYDRVIETLDTARDFLKNVFEKGADFFAIRTDTGTGKTENAITYAMGKDVAVPTLSGKLRDEIVSRATDKEMFAWGYRGINETEEADGYMPCIQPERFDLFRQKGFNPYKWICEVCPAQTECQARGYLSQPDRAGRSQILALPFPTAYLDGRLRNWAKMYLPREGLILHDDLPLASMFIEYQLSADRLRRILTDWKGTPAAEWAEILLSCFISRDWERMKLASQMLSDTEYNTVVQAFTMCRLPHTGAIVDADQLIKSQLVDYSTTDAIAKLPQIDAEKFDTPTILELFWERYPRLVDAPFAYDAATETFTFSFLPKPYQSKKVRVGFASATLDKDLITRIFPDIEFYDANTTEWVKGAEFYQLRTNRNPRGTVLNAVEKYTTSGEKMWEWDGLNETGADYYDKALGFIKAHPNEKHAVLSYKAVIDDKQTELDAHGVKTAWFGNLAGLDEAFKGVKNFHILFCPYVKPSDVDSLCKQLFGNDETPLMRDGDGNLERNADGTYADTRAQQVNDALVIGELLQAIGRARLNLYPNRVFLWTSFFVDAATNRTEATLYDEIDWDTAGNNLENLRGIVKTREDGDAKAYAESTGQSERTARRHTQNARKQHKSERDAEIFRRYADGESKKGIATALGIGQATVSRVLEKAQF